MSFRKVLTQAYETEVSSEDDWDDGHHKHVDKITVVCEYSGINLIQFDYSDQNNVTGLVNYTRGSYHGQVSTLSETSRRYEFVLESDEWIKTVKTYNGAGVRRIEIVTNKQMLFAGLETSLLPSFHMVTYEALQNEIIGGFHGNSSYRFLNQIGVYFVSTE